MTIGYHAPLAPAATGVADYAAAMLKALRAHCEVIVEAPRADVHFYHLGNNSLHQPVYSRFLAQPGVVLLHDANLHHFYLGLLERQEYVREFCRQYGAWHRDVAEQLWRSRASSAAGAIYYRYPMLAAVAETASAVVVHNAAAARQVRRHGPHASVHVLAHLLETPRHDPGPEAVRLRQRLGLSAEHCLLGVFGHLRESKRLPAILRAFHQARRRIPALRLLVAGRFASSELARSLAPALEAPGVLRAGFLSPHAFWVWAAAVDACLNLRFPSCGETSGIAIRLMGLSKPVLVTAGEEWVGFPPGSLIPIDHGPAEEEMLAEWMVALARWRDLGRQIGQRASRWVRQAHHPQRVAAELVRILAAAGGYN